MQSIWFCWRPLSSSHQLASAQSGFFSDWFNMVSDNAKRHSLTGSLPSPQPHRGSIQEFRYDIQWQTHNSGVTTDNYGVSKGLEIIPAKKCEVILAVPPYIVNNPRFSE